MYTITVTVLGAAACIDIKQITAMDFISTFTEQKIPLQAVTEKDEFAFSTQVLLSVNSEKVNIAHYQNSPQNKSG